MSTQTIVETLNPPSSIQRIQVQTIEPKRLDEASRQHIEKYVLRKNQAPFFERLNQENEKNCTTILTKKDSVITLHDNLIKLGKEKDILDNTKKNQEASLNIANKATSLARPIIPGILLLGVGAPWVAAGVFTAQVITQFTSNRKEEIENFQNPESDHTNTNINPNNNDEILNGLNEFEKTLNKESQDIEQLIASRWFGITENDKQQQAEILAGKQFVQLFKTNKLFADELTFEEKNCEEEKERLDTTIDKLKALVAKNTPWNATVGFVDYCSQFKDKILALMPISSYAG